MRQQLQTELQQLDQSLNDLLNELANYSHEALNQRPADGGWSAAQVIHHLLLSETLSMKYCQKKLSFDPELKRAGIVAAARAMFVRYYLLSPFKFQAPPMLDTPALPTESQLTEITQQYRAQRQAFAQFLADVPEKYLDKEVYKHPFGGRLSISGMMGFFAAHFQHHRKQALRAVNAN